MRCRKLLVLTPILFLLAISSVEASPYYITRPTYFPSKSGSYITFDTSLLPVSFNTLYRDTQTRWHFNNYWLTTTTDMTITRFFQNNQLTFTVTADSGETSKSQIYVPTSFREDGQPTSVTGATSWSYNSETRILTVNVLHSSTEQVQVEWRSAEASSALTYAINYGFIAVTVGSIGIIVLVAVGLMGVFRGNKSSYDLLVIIIGVTAIFIMLFITSLILNAFRGI